MKKQDVNVKKNKALIYVRCATTVGVLEQREACMETVKKAGMSCNPKTDVFTDVTSGNSTLKCPALLEMILKCRNSKTIRAVVAYSLERLSRDNDYCKIIHRELLKNGVEIILVKGTGKPVFVNIPNLTENIMEAIATRHMHALSGQVKRGLFYKKMALHNDTKN